jgi:murein DD-endopeptidase MepM/ murein hydrolase activator NlpD
MIDSLQFGSFRAKSRGPNGFTAFRTAAGAQAFRPFSLVHRKLNAKMPRKSYTLFIAANDSGGVRRLRIPLYAVQLLLVLSLVGGATVIFAAGSYSRMLWKVGNYNALRREQTNLKKQYRQLQTQVSDTNQRLNSLQSLATEVAVAYGITRFRQTPFGLSEPVAGPEGEFQQSVDQYNFLQTNASLMNGSNQSLHLLPTGQFTNVAVVPSLWPVVGEITGRFGERLDPFSGEGAFHSGVDIASRMGDTVRATADGVVTAVDRRAGYGRLVVIDHGFGVTTWYGHLAEFATNLGTHVKRGDVIGYEGASGHATGPHVHYEVRFYNTPVNPWRYLRGTDFTTAHGD